ncbi:DUF3352 domain-containing protein [Phormidium sp. LEGE 05292]|uniref:DUF3352 domain-containing protein n=1 Tax=[Phormidium] sp. LEGE 05292 TaxID=767427 RepID=UPI0018825D60|nr:DUF3352 domain-containing protein [Phormidium sp. LEGE 05292]MBE9228357.1 DUF3352 domain-containing protein [Phormidium sp. LEGE 05292]
MLTQKVSKFSELPEVSKFSKFPKFKALGVGAAVLIAAGATGGYLYLRGVFSDVSPLASAKLVPDEALVAGVVSTDGKPWSKLQQFGTTEAQQIITKSLASLQKQMFAENTKIDYAKDIQPWLGSVMLALLPSNTTQEVAATTPNYLVIIGIKDKISAISFATKLKKSSGGDNQDINYKGVKIWECSSNNEHHFIALLNEHLVISPQKKSLEAAIDTFKGEPSFADKVGAKLMLEKGIDLPNEIAEIYVPESQNAIAEVLDKYGAIGQLTPASIQQLKNMKSVVMGVGIDNLGIRMKAIGEVKQEPIKQAEFQPTPGKMVSKFPLNTVALLSGYGISQGWKEAIAQAQKNPQFNAQVNGIRNYLKENVNLDLDKDILPWMDREFAVGAFPATEGVLAPMGFSAALVVKTSDRQAAETALKKLDQLARTNSINIDRRHIEGKAVTEWSNDQGVLLGHGWLDKESMFVAVGRPIVEAMASSSKTLEKNQAFQTVTNTLPKPNTGSFYVDMDTVMSVFNNNFLLNLQLPLSSDTCAILNSIRGIGVTANKVNLSTSQMEIVFALKSKEPQSLAKGQ